MSMIQREGIRQINLKLSSQKIKYLLQSSSVSVFLGLQHDDSYVSLDDCVATSAMIH